jgi:hypothetical protein
VANVDVETLLVKLEGRITDFEKKMRKATEVAESSSGKIENTFKGLAGRVNKALGVIGIGLSATALVAKIRTAVGELGDLADAATQAGVSAESLQVFRQAVSQAGGEVEDADKALVKFNKNMGDVALTGKGPAADALKSIGINVEAAGFKSLTTEKKLGVVIDRLSGIKDQAKLASVASDIFGDKLGPKLLGVLAQGQQGLIDTRTEMENLHQLIANDMVAAGDTLDDKFKSWALTIDTIFKKAVIGGAESISTLVGKFDTLGKEMRDFIASPDFEKFSKVFFGITQSKNDTTGATPFTSGLPPMFAEKGPNAIGRRQLSFDPSSVRASEIASMAAMRAFQKSLEKPKATTTTTTVTPVDHEAETLAKAAQKKIDDTIKSLQHQEDQLGRTGREQAIYNALQQAGIDVTSKFAPKVEELAGNIYDLGTRQAAIDSLANSAFDLFENVISGSEDAGDAIGKFIQQLLLAEAKAAFLNAFNPSSPLGPISTLLGGLFGSGKAGGGDVMKGKVYPVGERGPELFAPNMNGKIIPNGVGGMSLSMPISISADGADASQLARLVGEVRTLQATLPRKVVSITRDARSRRLL